MRNHTAAPVAYARPSHSPTLRGSENRSLAVAKSGDDTFTAVEEALAIVNSTSANTNNIMGATDFGKRKLERIAILLHLTANNRAEPRSNLNLSSSAPAIR